MHNVTWVENTKGNMFRCNKCKTKTRFFPTLEELLRNPGMFKPNPIMDVKVDEQMREEHLRENGKLTDGDREFLSSLQEGRDAHKSSVWTLYGRHYEPCWEELAECWELYDPVTKQTLSYVDEPIDDVGRLKCIPVKMVEFELENSTFALKSEAEAVAEGLGVSVKENRLGPDDALAKLFEVVDRVNWKKA